MVKTWEYFVENYQKHKNLVEHETADANGKEINDFVAKNFPFLEYFGKNLILFKVKIIKHYFFLNQTFFKEQKFN